MSSPLNYKILGSQRMNKEQAREVAAHLVEHPEELPDFFEAFMDENWRYNQYLAHPLGLIADKNVTVLYPYLDNMIEWAERDDLHQSVRRNIVRTWQFMDLPEEHSGLIYDLCYNWVTDPNEAVGVRAFAMTVLANIACQFPELAPDVLLAIEQTLEKPTSGIRARAKIKISVNFI